MATACDSRIALLLSLLYQHWQVKSFRVLQQEAVLATLNKEDTILILPTGTCHFDMQTCKQSYCNNFSSLAVISFGT